MCQVIDVVFDVATFIVSIQKSKNNVKKEISFVVVVVEVVVVILKSTT